MFKLILIFSDIVSLWAGYEYRGKEITVKRGVLIV